MYELPVNTHRYFVEAVSEETHARTLLCKRFLGFIEQINKSQKSLPKQLLESIRLDTRSTTGKNIRKILLKVNKNCLSQVNKHDPILGSYCDVNDGDTWKVDMVREITDLRFGSYEVENFLFEEFEEIQNYLCISWSIRLSFLPSFHGFVGFFIFPQYKLGVGLIHYLNLYYVSWLIWSLNKRQ